MVNRASFLKVISTLLIVFLLLAGLKLPHLNQNLSGRYETATAVSLRILSIWDSQKAENYAFVPVLTYPNSANQNSNDLAHEKITLSDKQGNYYDVSHPPFAYIFPYVVFKLLQVKPGILSLQVFQLVLHFFTAGFIYLIICLLSIQKPFRQLFIPAFIGFVVYLFSPGVMWFQTNVYMGDVLVHFPFVLLVYTILKLLMRQRFYSTKYLVYYAFFLFLAIYTSWLGLFFAFAVFLYALIKLRYQKVFLPLIFITLGVSFFSIYLVFRQYSLVNGSEAYLRELLHHFTSKKVLEQSFFSLLWQKIIELKALLSAYLSFYLPLFGLLFFFVILSTTHSKMKMVFTKNGYRFLWLSTLPVLLFHFFLLGWSKYDFVALYGSLFLSVLIGILYDKMKRNTILKPIVLHSGIVLYAIISVAMYYYTNPLQKPSEAESVAHFIQENVKADERIVLSKDILLSPQLVYFAQRNMQYQTAKEIVQKNEVLITINPKTNQLKISRK